MFCSSATKRIDTLWLIGYDNKTLENVQLEARIEAVFSKLSVRRNSFNRSRKTSVL